MPRLRACLCEGSFFDAHLEGRATGTCPPPDCKRYRGRGLGVTCHPKYLQLCSNYPITNGYTPNKSIWHQANEESGMLESLNPKALANKGALAIPPPIVIT